MNVEVTFHALLRARERFGRFEPHWIQREVREALAAGRMSIEKPRGLYNNACERTLYVWVETGERVYALLAEDDAWVVRTTMRADVQKGAAA